MSAEKQCDTPINNISEELPEFIESSVIYNLTWFIAELDNVEKGRRLQALLDRLIEARSHAEVFLAEVSQ